MKFFKIAILIIVNTAICFSQTWRSTLYPSTWTPPTTKNFYTDAFLQDYSYAGYHRGEKSIPAPSGQVFDVSLPPYNADKTGGKDATFAIRKALADAEANNGGIVYLPKGTYKVNPGQEDYVLKISKSHIYIMGDGVGQTFIMNNTYRMRGKSIIRVSGLGSWNDTLNVINGKKVDARSYLTKDIMTPTNIIHLNNLRDFKVGDTVMIRNYINDQWRINDHKEPEWLGYGKKNQEV